MERKIAKALGIVGVLLGGAVALMPLTTYADAYNPGSTPAYPDDKGPAGTGEYTVGQGDFTDYEFDPGLNEEQQEYEKWLLNDILCKNNPASSTKCANMDGTTQINVKVDNSISLTANFKGTNDTDTIDLSVNMIGTGHINAKVFSVAEYTISLSAAEPDLKHTNGTTLIPALPADQTVLTRGQAGWGVHPEGDADENKYIGLTNTPHPFYSGTATTSETDQTRETPLTVGVSTNGSQEIGTYSTDVTVTAAMNI